jgi:hypothetical protein
MDISNERTKGIIKNTHGGPVFPIVAPKKSDIVTGITTREWFAGLAAQGILAALPAEELQEALFPEGDEDIDYAEIKQAVISNKVAKLAHKVAIQLIEHRGN